jgi:hypothetical protein
MRNQFVHRWRSVFIALLALGVAACTQSEWQELSINEGGFRILMRGQAHYARQPIETPAGRMVGHLYSSDRPDGYFAVGYSDYPIAHVIGSPAKDVLTGVRDTWVKRVDGKLTMSGAIEIDGKHPGVEFAAEGRVKGADTFLHGRLYLVDQRLYQVIALARKGEMPQGVVNRFLNSFKLTPGGAGMIQLTPDPGK